MDILKVLHGSIVNKYQNIENLGNDDIKFYVESLKKILKEERPEILRKIFSTCEEIEFIDEAKIEGALKREYAKKLNEGLFTINEAQKTTEEGIYGTFTKNEEVIVAAETLAVEDGVEVWPLIYPDITTFRRLNNPEYFPLVRIMGSGIGSGLGIAKENLRIIENIVSEAKVQLMLDGGISGIEDILLAHRLGFTHVLVNSCLFNKGKTPDQVLESLVSEFKKNNGILAI